MAQSQVRDITSRFFSYFYRNIPIIAAVFLLITLYWLYFFNQAIVRIDLTSNVKTKFKIYWAKEGRFFNENRSSSIVVRKGTYPYYIYLDDLGKVGKLRIDPAERPAKITIRRLHIKQRGYPSIELTHKREFDRLVPLNGISKLSWNKKKNIIEISTNSHDPQIELSLPDQQRDPQAYLDLFLVFIIALLIIRFTNRIHFQWKIETAIPYMMIFACTLMVVMASVSKRNSHPDEMVHVAAGKYFEDHWLSPEICTPGTESTYSGYGVSRLNSREISYLFAGKFSKLISPFFPFSTYLRFRLFNVLLFFIITGLCFKSTMFRFACIPLLISPQIWYVFSYSNSDAPAIFVMYLLLYQIVKDDSLFHQALAGEFQGIQRLKFILLGILAGFMFLIKLNFYFFIIFISVSIVALMIMKYGQNWKQSWLRLSVIGLIGIVLAGMYFAIDLSINGFDRKKKLYECREKLASPLYNPKNPLAKRHHWTLMKTRGVELKEVLDSYRWGEKTFRSSFGVYGYMTVSASKRYYNAVRGVAAILLIYIIFGLLIQAPNPIRITVLSFIACSFGLIFAALWKSWTVDLQTQGRYIVPIAGMLGYLLYQARSYISPAVLYLGVFSLHLISAYSFIFIGLRYIAKA